MSYVHRTIANAKRYVPEVRVSFHTEAQCYQVIGTGVAPGGTPDPTHQVLSASTQKQLAAPAGGFSVTLAGAEWVQRLRPNDLTIISMGYRGETLPTVMIGLIDSVQRTRSANGEPTFTTTVTGRDFGKIFLKSQLKFYPEIGAATNNSAEKFFLTEEGWITMMKYFTNEQALKGTPAVILDIIVRFILQKLNNVQWSVYDQAGGSFVKKTATLANILRYNFAQVNMFMPMIMTAEEFEGALWNLMERTAIKPFTELFVDTRDGTEAWNADGKPRVVPEAIEKASNPDLANLPNDQGRYPSPAFQFGSDGAKVVLAYRNTPFDAGQWKQLKTHELPEEDVISEYMSFGDEEHYNLFWAGTTLNPFGIDLKRIAPPLLNAGDVKRYGLSPLEVQIEGLALDPSQKFSQESILKTASQNFSAKLKAWYEKNHEHWSGTLEVRGKGDYKIGQRLVYPELDKEFYIEGVSQSFHMYTSFTTTLTVTRGMKIGTLVNSSDYLPKEPPPPPPPAIVAPPPAPPAKYHTVVRGNTLWALSKHYYGNPLKWRTIWEANKDMLIKRDKRNASDHGHWIYPGQVLRIPT